MFSIRLRARARVVFLPNRPNCVPSYPAPRCPVAPPCAAPTRPARGVSWFCIRQVRIKLFVFRKDVQDIVFDKMEGKRDASRPLKPCPALLPSPAPPRPNGLVVRFFPDMPCMKRISRNKWASVHSSAPKNEERLFPPLSKCWSTVDFVPLSVLSTS